MFRARSAPLSARVTWKRSSSPTRPGCSGARTAAASASAPSGANASRSFAHLGVEGFLDLRPLIGGSHRRISIMAARWRRSKSEPNPEGEASPRRSCAGFFREMLLIRRFEEKVEDRFRAGELPGFLHVAIGQEAAATGVCAALAREDVIASTHRAHGHAIAKGTPIERIMAELYGKVEGCSRRLRRLDAPLRRRGREPRRERGRRRRAARDRRRGARVPDARARSASPSRSSATAPRTPARSTSR